MGLDWWIYLIIILTLFPSIGILLLYLRMDIYYTFSFTILSLAHASVPIWEGAATVEALFYGCQGGSIPGAATFPYMLGLWGITFGIMDASFVFGYAVIQHKTWKQFAIRPLACLTMLVVGVHFFVATWFADFGFFIIQGIEYFTPTAACWMTFWGPLPSIYWVGTFFGGGLLALSLFWAFKHRRRDFMTLVTF